MAKKRFTPEEQLLNLIEEDSSANPLKRRKKSLFSSVGALNIFFAGFRRRISARISRLKTAAREPNLKSLNRTIILFSVILLLYSVGDFFLKGANMERIYKKQQALPAKKLDDEEVFVPRSFLYYLEMVQRRNIFSPIALQTAKKQEPPKEDLTKLSASLKVVGISWGKEPVAMIEDQAAKKTYFLKKGDSINQFQIKDVLKDRVILEREGQTLELM